MPTIVHFEIPADDVDRAKKFYSDLFGWKMERWPKYQMMMMVKIGSSSSNNNMEYSIIGG